jgi:hypothetical protein
VSDEGNKGRKEGKNKEKGTRRIEINKMRIA